MKKIIWLLFISFTLVMCKKETTEEKKKEEEIIDGKEPAVTKKYYLKFKLDDKWVLIQNDDDDYVGGCSHCVQWWDGNYELKISDFFSDSRVTKEIIFTLEGNSYPVQRESGPPSLPTATIASRDLGAYSCCENSESVKVHVKKVTDINKRDKRTNEHVMVIEGSIDNLKLSGEGKTYNFTNGTYKLPVGTDTY